MTLISKTAGVASLASCIHDIHKTALISSNNAYMQTSANGIISSSIGNQKADKVSYKDAQRKNWLAQNNFGLSFQEFFARVGGYISGFAKASVRYIPNFILATIALVTKKEHKNIANLAAVGLGVVEAIDFIKNATNIHQKTDYLK